MNQKSLTAKTSAYENQHYHKPIHQFLDLLSNIHSRRFRIVDDDEREEDKSSSYFQSILHAEKKVFPEYVLLYA